jgi:hypothetical protein
VWIKFVAAKAAATFAAIPRSCGRASAICMCTVLKTRYLRLAYPAVPVQIECMGEGRLIRVRKYRGDPTAVAYLVAVSDKDKAVDLIRQKVGGSDGDIEDLGRVSEALLMAMSVREGEFVPIEGVRHVAQQQQQPPSQPVDE